MKNLNVFFFGSQSITFEDGAYFYGTFLVTGAIAIFTLISMGG